MMDEQTMEFVELCRHEAIAKKLGKPQQGDMLLCSDGIIRTFKDYDILSVIATNSCGVDQRILTGFVILSPVFDYQHPERGLWGMMPGDFFACDKAVDGSVSIYCKGKVFVGPSLPIALAKAIIWQHERSRT